MEEMQKIVAELNYHLETINKLTWDYVLKLNLEQSGNYLQKIAIDKYK